MEQLRDTYASDSLVTLAKSLGFNGEAAHINHDIEEYTLGIIQKWLILEHNIIVLHGYSLDMNIFSTWIFDKSTNTMAQGEEKISHDDALEYGLRKACMMLIEKENAYKVLE